MHALSQVGVPYSDADIKNAEADGRAQGEQIAADLAKEGVTVAPDTQMVAVISYLQRLGKKSSAPPSKATETVSMEEKR
jgi:cytochrome c oxidase cbb3-type subunit I/II